jgi:hypothetical protein
MDIIGIMAKQDSIQTPRFPLNVAVKEFFLSRFADVVNLNAFIAKSPQEAGLTYKTSRLAGLWQLDLEEDWKNRWTIGYHIDGVGDVTIKYSLAIKKARYGYVDGESDELRPPYVIWLRGGLIIITLPNESDADIVMVAPQVCNRNPHRESVYIWRYIYFSVLDCNTGLEVLETEEEFENWIKAKAEEQIIHWFDWYVIPGAVDSEEEWAAVVRQAIRGRPYPTPDEVIELVHKLL